MRSRDHKVRRDRSRRPRVVIYPRSGGPRPVPGKANRIVSDKRPVANQEVEDHARDVSEDASENCCGHGARRYRIARVHLHVKRARPEPIQERPGSFSPSSIPTVEPFAQDGHSLSRRRHTPPRSREALPGVREDNRRASRWLNLQFGICQVSLLLADTPCNVQVFAPPSSVPTLHLAEDLQAPRKRLAYLQGPRRRKRLKRSEAGIRDLVGRRSASAAGVGAGGIASTE